MPASTASAGDDDRNAVMRRPGGGSPDPFQVGTSDYGDDDFFAQFRPKGPEASPAQGGQDAAPGSSTDGSAGQSVAPEGEFPTRRSRRRFNPRLYDTDQVPTAATPEPPQHPVPEEPVSEPVPQRLEPQREDPQHPAPQESEQQPRPEVEPREQGQVAPEPEPRSPFAPQPDRQAPVQPEVRQPEAPRPESSSRDQSPFQPSEPVEPAPPTAVMPTIPPQRDAFGRTPAQRQEPTEPKTEAVDVHPADAAGQPPEPPRSAGFNASFTQLIEGLPHDPADNPIASPRFDQTGIVPMPPLPAADPQQQAARERATAFYTDESPRLRQHEQRVIPDQDTPGEQAAPNQQQAPEQPQQAANEMPALPNLAGQQQRRRDDQPLSSPFVQDAGEQAPTARRDERVEDDFAAMLGFAPEDSAAAESAANEPQPRGARRGWRSRGGDNAEHNTNAAPRGGSTAVGASRPEPAQVPPVENGSRGGDGGSITPDEPFSQEEIANRRRGVKTILIAAAAALVLVIGAFALKGMFGGGGNDEAAPAPSASESVTPNDQETPQQTEQQPTEEAFAPVAFQSESGNIRCQVNAASGANCQILERGFNMPEGACTADTFSGAAVGVNGEGVMFPCLTGDIPASQVVPYDEPIQAGSFTCAINYDTGVRCDNGKGASFTMEYNAGIATEGPAAADNNPQVAVSP